MQISKEAQKRVVTGSETLTLILDELSAEYVKPMDDYVDKIKRCLEDGISTLTLDELNKIQKKYAGKQDEKSMMKQNQEMLAVYQKYNINPIGGCLFSFLQLPIFIAFFEALQRTPVIFEDKFLGLQLGTTPAVGIGSSTFYIYAILVLLIGLTTHFSFKMNNASSSVTDDPTMKMMPTMMMR